MININDYIAEKLHISKNLLSNNKQEFIDYLDEHGWQIDKLNHRNGAYRIAGKDNKDYPCIYIDINDEHTGWDCSGPANNQRNDSIKLWYDMKQFPYRYPADNYDKLENGMFAFSLNNAQEIVKILDDNKK